MTTFGDVITVPVNTCPPTATGELSDIEMISGCASAEGLIAGADDLGAALGAVAGEANSRAAAGEAVTATRDADRRLRTCGPA